MKRNIAMEDCRNFDPYGGVCTIDGCPIWRCSPSCPRYTGQTLEQQRLAAVLYRRAVQREKES